MTDKIDAYLYSRVSTKIQLAGLGIDRQDNALTQFLNAHPELVLKGTFRDLGISAFRGDNKLKGEFGALLKLVESGKLPKGTHIVVESLDRISRDKIWEADDIFKSLMRAEIVLVTVMDGVFYRKTDNAMADLMMIMGALMVMARAAEESETKSKRSRDNWAAKRVKAISGELMTAMIPAWLRVEEGRAVEDQRKAEIVNHIYEWCAEGHGGASILHKLNAAGMRSIGVSGVWSCEYIRRILSNRAVLGEAQPGFCNADTSKRRKPSGAPIQNYFPRIISAELWERAQTAQAIRRQAAPNAKVRGDKITNLFVGLCRCGECGGPMVVCTHHRNPQIHYLRCRNRYVTKTCERGSNYAYKPLETAILRYLRNKLADDQAAAEDPSARLTEAIVKANAELGEAEHMLIRFYTREAKNSTDDPVLDRMIDEQRSAIAALRTKIADLQHERSTAKIMRPAMIAKDVAAALISAADRDPDARAKLAMEIRSIVSSIGFFAGGYVLVSVGNHRWVTQFQDAQLDFTRSSEEDIVHPPGSRAAEFIGRIARLKTMTSNRADLDRVNRRLNALKNQAVL